MAARLKSLELHGYKTFANRTVFEFSEAITAIVGPNGSGKSNIADSLRWVLGEQSYHLLRGKRTEDMIFAGSEHRPRAGMASATVTFDNSDGWLPIDFSEVAITRRAYRDGENEYLINGQRMRLRDVSELLSSSGLAERTYTIIGQGLVDAALALKAEERRRLFEEAAGIGLHRSRREEALRRLDSTRRNLERVHDILAELKPRLSSLDRQSRRAQEYLQLKADLRVVLHEWYGYHWHKAQQDLSGSKREQRKQEAALDSNRREQHILDQKLKTIRLSLQEKRHGLNAWHHQLALLHTQREQGNLDLAVAQERRRAFETQQHDLHADLLRLEEEIGVQQERLAAQAAEEARLQAALVEADSQLAASRQEFSQAQAEQQRHAQAYGQTQQQLEALTRRQNQLQAASKESEHILVRDQAAEQTRRDEIASLSVRLAELQNAAAQAVQARRAAESQAAAAEQAQRAYLNRMAEQQRRSEALNQERSAANAGLATLKAQLRVLEQAEASLAGYAAGTKLLLEAGREKRLKGVRSSLVQDLVVPATYETAIAAALGELLQAVVVEDSSDASSDLLLEKARRGAILPLNSIQPPRVDAPQAQRLAGMAGVIGRAAELVSAPADLVLVVELLLGQVYVVRQRQDAQRILAELASQAVDSGLRLVTLDGQVFQPGGAVFVSGSKGGDGERGERSEQSILGRQRQHRTLVSEMGAAQEQIEGLLSQAGELEEELSVLQADGKRLESELNRIRAETQAAVLADGQSRLAVEQVERQLEWHAGQRESLLAELGRRADLLKQQHQELNDLHAEQERLSSRLQEQTSQAAALTLDEVQAKMTHWNAAVQLQRGLSGEAEHRRKDLQAALGRVSRLEQDTRQRSAALVEAQAALEIQRSSSQTDYHQVGELLAALQQQIEPAEVELEAAEAEQQQVEAAEELARQALNQAEHVFAQARIAHSRNQEALETLRARIEEDFGLVAFEYEEQVSGPNPLPLTGLVEQLPRIDSLSPEVEESMRRLQAQLRRMGPINPEAQAEFEEVQQRHIFLVEQVADLEKAEADVREVIRELDVLMQQEFNLTFSAVAEEFKGIFTRLFGGGSARLILSDPDDLTNTGIEIEARLPGRRTQGLVLLSGGERSLTAAALIFALLKVSPTPFCLLDEVDAMLDEANVGRFRELLAELSQNTQFVIVTHNRNTVQAADVIYGVTMGRDSCSQVISLKLDEVHRVVEER